VASPIRVLVVDDSALIRQMLTHALELDPRIEVVGVARDGAEAIEKVRELRPDVVTLDIQMPGLTGIEALPFIMRDSEARVLMLSSVDDPDTTYLALEQGAVDFIPKPRGGFASSLADLSDLLAKKIKTAYRIPPHKRGQLRASVVEVAVEATVEPTLQRAPTAAAARARMRAGLSRLVVVAASTGGPPALERVFGALGPDLPAAFLVVQHLPSGFTASFARRLARIAGFPVVEGETGMRVEPGKGYLAPHGMHMIVNGRAGHVTTLCLEDGPTCHGVKPSADPLFESAAGAYGEHVTGVVLTGMGVDGARGLGVIRAAGGETIVQDEATSVVWGMPGASVRMGAAGHVVPIDRVAGEIRRTVREGS
jgi:two-component system chemotaxis response regulator CheB